MPDELLMIMTSNGTLGDSGRPTGVWVEEVCVPLKAFRDAGFIVSAASPRGGRPPIGPAQRGIRHPMSSAAVAQATTAAVRDII